jgi:predicted nucleic acid-binding protein
LAGIGLTEKEYYRVIEQAAEHSLTGGAIYDRLILECAQKCSADVVYTLNKKHFAALAPALAARIKAP